MHTPYLRSTSRSSFIIQPRVYSLLFKVQTPMKKIHPSSNKRNITVRYDFHPQSTAGASKKLRRLPHIFGKLLELPFYSDADVSIHETSESLRFVVDTDDDIGSDIAAHTIQICPGVIKVVVRNEASFVASGVGDGDLSLWRFRLPEYTQPELATAAFSDGELVVTVPKDVNLVRNEGVWGEGNGNGSGSRFVLVR